MMTFRWEKIRWRTNTFNYHVLMAYMVLAQHSGVLPQEFPKSVLEPSGVDLRANCW